MKTLYRSNTPVLPPALMLLLALFIINVQAANDANVEDLEAYSRDFRLIERLVRSGPAQAEAFVKRVAKSDLPQATKIQIIAVAYVDQYRLNNRTTYRKKGEVREFGLGAKISDCSAMTASILQSAGIALIDSVNSFVKKSDGCDGFHGMIRMVSMAADVREPYRMGDPKAGDIIMWKLHVGIVTRVTKNVVFWANMGPGGDASHQAALIDGRRGLAPDFWTTGGREFWGFYTLPGPSELLNLDPRYNAVIKWD